MGWEERGGRRYYYHKRRRDGRVVSEYAGRGEFAEAMACIEALDRQRVGLQRHAQGLERAEIEAVDPLLDDLEITLTNLTRAVLLVNGYHTHKGTWRRIRGKSKTATPDPGP